MERRIQKSDEAWRRELTPEQFRVTRRKGTEPPFRDAYHAHKEKGVYRCVCCGTPLFGSETKFDSGTGWPSFREPMAPERVETKVDDSHGMERTEVLCAVCDAHLGHVFDDGPPPRGKRYCINSVALRFEKEEV